MVSLFDEGELILEFPTIFGISTSLRAYKLAFYLTQHRNIEVYAREDLEDYGSKNTYINYVIHNLDEQREYLLIKNKGEKGWYYPSYKKVDYLLCSLTEEGVSEDLTQQIASTIGVSICFVLNKPNQKEILNFTKLL